MICDQHSIEYAFEDLQPELNGVRLGLYINGTAVLENDPGYAFAVSTIILDGDVKDKLASPSYFGGRPRKNVKVILERPKADDHSPNAVLFRLIEAAIYEDRGALDAWQSELEAA